MKENHQDLYIKEAINLWIQMQDLYINWKLEFLFDKFWKVECLKMLEETIFDKYYHYDSEDKFEEILEIIYKPLLDN